MLSTFLKTASLKGNLVYVGGTSASANSSAPSFSLTSLSGGIDTKPSIGDIVIVCLDITDSTTRTFTCSTGYIKIANLKATNTYSSQLAVFYKVLTTAETSVSFGGLGTTQFSCFCAHVWRGVDSVSPLDATSVTLINSSNGIPNASSITTTTNNAVVLAVGSVSIVAAGSLTVPTGMENMKGATQSSMSIGIASIALSSVGTYDPPQFNGGTTSTSASSCTVTMALRTS